MLKISVKLKPRRFVWYARVRRYVGGKEKEIQVPLLTKSKVAAGQRLSEVKKKKEEIIELYLKGQKYIFPWMSDDGKVTIEYFTLKDAVDQWMSKREGRLSKKTIELNQNGLNYFLKYIGKKYPLESISTNQIEGFSDWLDGRGLSKNTINIHLRTIKSMFNYYLKIDKLPKIPHIQQLRIPKTEPIYITDNEFQSIMELTWLSDFYKRVFLFYRETGMRLNEPMMSVLDGDWIDIPNTSKSQVARNIKVDKPMQLIFNKLKDWLENGYGSTLKTPDDHISKKFKNVLRSIGADNRKHFHSLRHTFAVRSLIRGTSIYDLKLLMGHSSVTTTEVYSNMNLKRVAQDFPTIVTSHVNMAKIGAWDTKTRDTMTLSTTYMS